MKIEVLFIGFNDYLFPLLNSNTPKGLSFELADYSAAL
jgi:hypothetical protein